MLRPQLIRLSRRSLALGLLVALVAVCSQGCGSGKAKQSVLNGRVTYKDAPVTGGSMKFHPANEGKEGAAAIPGTINPDGTFSFGGVPRRRLHRHHRDQLHPPGQCRLRHEGEEATPRRHSAPVDPEQRHLCRHPAQVQRPEAVPLEVQCD